VVTVQPYLDELVRRAPFGPISLVGGYSDDGIKAQELDAEVYARVTRTLVLSGDPLASFDRGEFLRVQTHPELAALVAVLEADEGLREAVRSLLACVFGYVSSTGELLDTAGSGNIVFIRSEGAWKYILVDALSIHSEPVMDVARKATATLARKSQLTRSSRLLLMKALNFLRTVNGVAACIGVRSPITLSAFGVDTTHVDFLGETRLLAPH
jgi:hypothetical protein